MGTYMYVGSGSTVDWDGGNVVTTHLTVAGLLSTGTVFLCYFWWLGHPVSSQLWLLWFLHPALRILATLPRGSLCSLTRAVSLTLRVVSFLRREPLHSQARSRALVVCLVPRGASVTFHFPARLQIPVCQGKGHVMLQDFPGTLASLLPCMTESFVAASGLQYLHRLQHLFPTLLPVVSCHVSPGPFFLNLAALKVGSIRLGPELPVHLPP